MPHLRRLLPTLGVALVLLAVAAPAGAADRVPTTGRGGILVVQVQPVVQRKFAVDHLFVIDDIIRNLRIGKG